MSRPSTLIIKRLRDVPGKSAGTLNAARRKAIVKAARAEAGTDKVSKLQREDTATGSGHVAFAMKDRV